METIEFSTPADLNESAVLHAWKLLGIEPSRAAKARLRIAPDNFGTAVAIADACGLYEIDATMAERFSWELHVGDRCVISRMLA